MIQISSGITCAMFQPKLPGCAYIMPIVCLPGEIIPHVNLFCVHISVMESAWFVYFTQFCIVKTANGAAP